MRRTAEFFRVDNACGDQLLQGVCEGDAGRQACLGNDLFEYGNRFSGHLQLERPHARGLRGIGKTVAAERCRQYYQEPTPRQYRAATGERYIDLRVLHHSSQQLASWLTRSSIRELLFAASLILLPLTSFSLSAQKIE